MTKINYTTNSDARTDRVTHPPNAVRIELQGNPNQVAAIATLLQQQTEVLEESGDIQEVGASEVQRQLVVREIPDLTPTNHPQ